MAADDADGTFGWEYTGKVRPVFADEPKPGQESVWDYPRPPRLEPDARLVIVRLGSVEIARTRSSVRVLETASPPTFYLPPGDVHLTYLEPASGASFCEWKGAARYWTIVVEGQRLEGAAWSYPDPTPAFAALRDYVSFYPARLDCLVAGEHVRPQPGGFDGGWLTSEIVGPVKGADGTDSW